MKNIAVLNAISLRPPAARPLIDGTSAFQRALTFARGLPGVEHLVILSSTPSVNAFPLPEYSPELPRD